MWPVFVFVLPILSVASKAVTGKAFLCRDPDTGKLHTINSTWPSTTFCGNYHCRLRKKNVTETELETIRQINLTNHDIQSKILNLDGILNNEFVQSNKRLNPIGFNEIIAPETKVGHISTDRSVEGDRYLTQKEIDMISTILKSVKKSDLEALVEVYHLAQNIYDEIDKPNSEAILKDAVNYMKGNTTVIIKNVIQDNADAQKVSYWYDPIISSKHSVQRIKPHERPKEVIKKKPIQKNIGVNPTLVKTPTLTRAKEVNYFDGALTTQDFGRLPYYYPITSFHRISSYVHPLTMPYSPNPYQTTTAKLPEPQTTKAPILTYQKELKPVMYLQYPFFNLLHNYNWSMLQTSNNNKNYVEHMNSGDNNRPDSKAVLINPDLENIQELSLNAVNKRDKSLHKVKLHDNNSEDIVHDWQTDPISKTILEEVRAHIEKIKYRKPLSLRKKIKLERVAKVVRLDESNKRSKRNAMLAKADAKETEFFEVFIEKTTCQSNDTVPGFFRHGNLSNPFPQCCPQRIGD